MSIYEKIKDLCKERGTTVGAVEREAGLGKGCIDNWSDHSPRVDNVQKVASVLGVRVGDLLGE